MGALGPGPASPREGPPAWPAGAAGAAAGAGAVAPSGGALPRPRCHGRGVATACGWALAEAKASYRARSPATYPSAQRRESNAGEATT